MRSWAASAAAITTALALIGGGAPAIAAPEPVTPEPYSAPIVGAEQGLGQAFPGPVSVVASVSTQGVDDDGDALVFWATAGSGTIPAMLQVTEVATQKVVFRQRVASGTVASAAAFSPAEGAVYLAMTTGEFYRWSPGDSAVTTLRAPLHGESIMSLAVSPDGVVYGGTSPGGRVFSYESATRSTKDLGRINDRATSVNSLSVDDTHLYVGSEPAAQLTRFDRSTGDSTPIALPAELGAQQSAHDQSLAGGHLFVRVQPSNAAVVYRTDDLSLQNVVPRISGRPISGADPTGRYVYFRHTPAEGATAVFRYDLQEHTYASTGWAPNVFPRSFSFMEHPDQDRYPGTSVVLASTNGRLYTWSEQGRAGTYLGETSLHSVPSPIVAAAATAPETVFAAAADGRLARFSSEGAPAGLAGLSGIETLAAEGERLYVASRGGELRVVDTAGAWDPGVNPAAAAEIGEGQDRPVALLPLDDSATVAVGSIGSSSGGAITIWDPATGDLRTVRDPAGERGVVSLAQHAGIVYAGTAIRPGAANAAAELLAFDPESGDIRFRKVPVPGAASIDALAFDDEGILWGIAGQHLFSFDVGTGEVIGSKRLFSSVAATESAGRALAFRDDGLHATVDGRLVRFDTETWSTVVLADAGAAGLSTMADGGLLYHRHGQAFIWDFELPSVIDPVIPSSTATLSPEGTGWLSEPVTVTLSTETPWAELEFTLDGADWSAYREPIVVSAEGEHSITYRARAAEGHIERPRELTFGIDSAAPVTRVRQVDDVIALAAADAASGVASTEYRIGDADWTRYDGVVRVTAADDRATLAFRSTDAAGNVEETRTHEIGTAGDAADRVTEHGDQVQKVQVLASLTTMSPDGRPLGIYIGSGNSNVRAELSVIDLASGEPVLQTRIPYGNSSQRAIAVSPVDGAVYFGTSDVGHVYRYRPGAADVEHLATAPKGSLVWSMAIGDDGTVWYGVYPTGRLYSLDPETGSVTDHGQAVAGEQYIDSIAPDGDTIYVGTQANAKLAAFDRATGVFTELSMPEGHKETAISELDIRDGRLFAGTGSNIHVRDLDTGEWVDTIANASPRVSPVDPRDGDLVYARVDGQIQSYRMSTGELTPIGARPNATPESWNWLRIGSDEQLLVMTYWNGGRTYGFSVTGGEGFYLSPPLLGAAAPLISLGHDTSGNVYSGAFLSPPGMGRFDPRTGAVSLLAGTSQVEGYGTFNDKLVFGRYPQGSLYLYDPSRPWEYGTNPQQPLELGDEQSRPHGFVQLDEDTVIVASVPKPGTHGGALTLWQPEDATFTVHRDVVEDQTPSSIVLHDGTVYGGTSIEGGYGIDPVTTDPVLYAWDPETASTLWTAPFRGAKTVAGLAVAPDGMIWAIVDGRRIVEFDPSTREVLRTIVVDEGVPIDRFGDNDQMLFDHGRLFVSMAERLFVLDTVTEQMTVLLGKDSGRDDGITHVTEMTRDAAGDLYVIARETQLASYDLPDDVTKPEVRIAAVEGTPDGMRVTFEATDGSDAIPLVQTSSGDGEWSTSPLTAQVLVPFGAELEYRAIDDAWNASDVATYRAPKWSPGDASVEVGSAKARPGAALAISGEGFVPLSVVGIRLAGAGDDIVEITTDDRGAFASTLTLPATLSPGRTDLVASGIADATASAKLVITPRG